MDIKKSQVFGKVFNNLVALDDLSYRLYGLYRSYGFGDSFATKVSELLDTEFKNIDGAEQIVREFISIKAKEERENMDKPKMFNPLIKGDMKNKLKGLIKSIDNKNE